jgi:hypothetical protein
MVCHKPDILDNSLVSLLIVFGQDYGSSPFFKWYAIRPTLFIGVVNAL